MYGLSNEGMDEVLGMGKNLPLGRSKMSFYLVTI
jgi:hypothetical protein